MTNITEETHQLNLKFQEIKKQNKMYTKEYETFTNDVVISLPIKVFSENPNFIPEFKTEGSAGFDFSANIANTIIIHPFERRLIPTGLRFELPIGYELQVRPRSGLAIKNGVTVLNSPGTVDADYRGEVQIILINLGDKPFVINEGDRIAQGIISKYSNVTFIKVDDVNELTETKRGENGFGSTGV